MEIVKKSIKKLKIRKNHLDWVAGALSIPVLLTVIILNLNNLNSQKKDTSPTPTPQEKVIIVPQNTNPTSNQPTNTSCKKEIGPISITSPKEDETVSSNPVNVIIKYGDASYCSVVWSYRVNNGQWSEYNSNSVSLYNLPNGNIKFDLRIQSTVSQDTDTLTRNFKYQNNSATPTLLPSATP